MKKCLFAGTFDPITTGHESIVKKCLKKFDEVYLVIGVNPEKTPVFSVDERKKFIENVFGNNDKIKIFYYDGLMVDFIKNNKIDVYVRGIRNDGDIEFEKINENKSREFYPELKVEYVYADESMRDISSAMIRKRLKNGESIEGMVPVAAINDVITAFAKKN